MKSAMPLRLPARREIRFLIECHSPSRLSAVAHPAIHIYPPQAVRLVVSRLRGRAVQTSAPTNSKRVWGVLFFATEFSTCELSGGVDAKWLGSLSLLEEM